MEVAEQQWRREWAGTAEYGKVRTCSAGEPVSTEAWWEALLADKNRVKWIDSTKSFTKVLDYIFVVVEGGVTRRIARAMEVLHASGPGARMKVMRAAYHTTAGPGVPASSVMVHASRRVYSSGFDYREPPSLPTQPLEISSTPLALLQDQHADTENYKVTEPDDLEISEPSKWKSSSGGSIRMPSEESSSTDNASIIDLDARNHKSVYRKYSCDSENSERSSRLSPLFDAPALSTLKFKTFLNNHSDWNNRRKSYSFEDTSPLTETILHSNDTLAMESSTDSGICKSTEIVNENQDDITPLRYNGTNDRDDKRDDTFQNWLSNNKQNNYYKGTKFKSYRDREKEDDPKESNITLQSTGKVSITLPITLETEQEYKSRKNYEENQRKMKRVEFCKTELHFAAETGRVNIIATDEKPPPSNDFRKRRSAFVPMRDVPERPITLFGEKSDDFPNESNSQISEYNEIDENTAATKSILKNKIPKPKPYLLGENMAFGIKDEPKGDETGDLSYVPTAVSLINKQLQSEKRYINEESASLSRQHVSTKTNEFRATKQGPLENMASRNTTYSFEGGKQQKFVRIHDEKNKYSSPKKTSAMIRSPTPARLKTRELRESDLTYFGVDTASSNIEKDKYNFIKSREMQDAPALHDILQSVKLIQQVSNSVCNSESEDASEYQNVPINANYVPKPTPRLRSKLDDKPNYIDEIVLRPILEQDKTPDIASRRSKLKKHEETNTMKSRSRSEPRKSHHFNSFQQTHRQVDHPSRSRKEHSISDNESQNHISTKIYKADPNPIYVNLNKPTTPRISKLDSKQKAAQKVPRSNDSSMASTHRKDATKSGQDIDGIKHKPNRRHTVEENNKRTLEKNSNSLKRNTDNNHPDRTDKIQLSRQKMYGELSNEPAFDAGTNNSSVSKTSNNSNLERKEHRSRSLHRHSNAAPKQEKHEVHPENKKYSAEQISSTDLKVHKRQPSKDKTNNRAEITKVMPKVVQNSNTKKESSLGRPSHREYVINYDDKNGTVSSICKIRPGSGSPRRKKVVKEVIKEKFKENLKNKSSDKAALLQPEEGHQRNSNTRKGDRKWKKAHIERSCQLL